MGSKTWVETLHILYQKDADEVVALALEHGIAAQGYTLAEARQGLRNALDIQKEAYVDGITDVFSVRAADDDWCLFRGGKFLTHRNPLFQPYGRYIVERLVEVSGG